MSSRREQATLAIFLVMSVLAGGNAVGVRFSNRELEPLWGATLRFSLSAAVLLIAMFALRRPMPRGMALAGAALYGLFSFGGAFALAYYGLVRVQAGLGQTLMALVPLATLVLAVVHRQERMHGAGVLGTGLAIAGIAIASGGAEAGSAPLVPVLAMVGASLCFAEAAVLAHRFPSVHPVVMNAVGMASGSIFLFGATLIGRERITLPERAATWTAIVFVLYVIVLQRWEASRASYTFVLIPIFTVIFSAWLDDETVGLALVGGGLLVLAGVYARGAAPRARGGEKRGAPASLRASCFAVRKGRLSVRTRRVRPASARCLRVPAGR